LLLVCLFAFLENKFHSSTIAHFDISRSPAFKHNSSIQSIASYYNLKSSLIFPSIAPQQTLIAK